MITIVAISGFLKRISCLLDVRRGVYSGVDKEIRNAFEDKSIDDIRCNRDMILIQDTWRVIKLRLPDKKQKLSKRDSFRLIYLVSMIKDKVVLLDIYPKNGPSQQLDIEDARIQQLLSEFVEEQGNGTLKSYI